VKFGHKRFKILKGDHGSGDNGVLNAPALDFINQKKREKE